MNDVCFWIVGEIVGYPTAVQVQCSINGSTGVGQGGPASPTGWGSGVCRVAGGHNLPVWAVVVLADNTNVVSNTIVVP